MAHTPEHRLHDMLKDFDTAMLMTSTAGDKLRARPMGVAELTNDGEIYFVTAEESAKVDEIKSDSDVTLAFQNGKTFVSLNGTASIMKDQDLIDDLWSEAWRVWFPEGKKDPSLCIIKVTPASAEYWDSSGGKAISYAFQAAKAYIKGETPKVSREQHGKLNF